MTTRGIVTAGAVFGHMGAEITDLIPTLLKLIPQGRCHSLLRAVALSLWVAAPLEG